MRDGRTRRLRETRPDLSYDDFATEFKASVVCVGGGFEGIQTELDKRRVVVGRGADVDLVVSHPLLSRQHAVLEFAAGGYRVRDLGSLNGIAVDGRRVEAADLEPGDRFQLGEVEFQYLLEVREAEPETYELIVE